MAKVFKSTPVGRIVTGSNPIGSTVQGKDDRTGALKYWKDGTTPLMETFVGLAFAKTDPAWIAHKAEIMAMDRAACPAYFDAAGNRIPQMLFADKIIDGDGYDKKGKHRALKQGYAGHEILMCSSGFAPELVKHDGARWVPTPEGSIKCGDYVQVYYGSEPNGSTDSPGMFRNLEKIAFAWAGDAIVGGVDANDAFGAPPPAPAGALTTPQAPALTAPPPAAPPVAPAAPAAPPHAGYMAAGAPPPPPAPAAPAGPVMTATATSTYEGYIGAGWTEAQIIAGGFMLPR